MRSIKFKIIVYISSLLFMYGCQTSTLDKPKELSPLREGIGVWQDSVLLGGVVKSIAVDGDDLWISDRRNHRALHLDGELNFKQKLGREGAGPGELKSAYHLAYSGKKLYLQDLGNRRINVYDYTGNFLSTISPPLVRFSKFDVDEEGNVYGSIPTFSQQKYSYAKFDASGKLIKAFGKIDTVDTQGFPSHSQLAHIQVLAEGRIVAIKYSHPSIEVFDKSGNRLAHFFYGDLPLLAPIINKVKREYAEHKGEGFVLAPLVRGVAVNKNNLYIVVNNISESEMAKEVYYTSEVLAFEIETEIKLNEIFRLTVPEMDQSLPRRFTTLGMDKSATDPILYAFEQSGNLLYRYKLQ